MMKKLLFNIFLLLEIVFLGSSCSNSAYDEENFYPSKYHKIMLFKESGKQTLNLTTSQVDYQDTMVVLKSGSNPMLRADINFYVLNQTTVNSAYNKIEGMDYRVIPQNCYKFNNGSEMRFESGEIGKYLIMTIYADKIYTYMQNNENITSKTKFVIPIKMTSTNDTINIDKGYVFKIINVKL